MPRTAARPQALRTRWIPTPRRGSRSSGGKNAHRGSRRWRITASGSIRRQVPIASRKNRLSSTMTRRMPVLAQSPQGPTHNYTVKTLTSCSAADSFAAVRSPNGSAPGAPAAQDGITTPINLWGIESPNPITQNVIPSTMTIINTTLPDHVFYPGSVTINVNSLGPSSSTITYNGTGNSSSPILNDIVGYLYFGLMNALTTIGCAASSGMGGGAGP